ncbi:OmpA family protein [Roseibium porphyridii]|uniref:OmpA family protein n=1 Tax=Roseibium porphyridii TaxID=2866279 RepID=A0ABY8F5Y5_9HYPH|nr:MULTISPECIES: OmpA family protein [Stappiaceae]QFT29959.1 Outer membrane lipoprotein Omp16 precursor [Labrenzia sp. THAF82]WFE90636.1 OmpA family protein [Roseibium sp. KMA01]
MGKWLGRSGQGVIVAGICLLGLAGCNSAGGLTSPDVTNAPAAGFVEIKPGSEEEFIMNVGRRVYFAKGSSVVSDEAKMTLQNQAKWLKDNRKWLVKVQGHADDPGSEAAQKTLSTKRADAVVAELVKLGVPSQRVWAKGYGVERPVTDCDEVACQSQNRRVVVNLREEYDDSAPQARR